MFFESFVCVVFGVVMSVSVVLMSVLWCCVMLFDVDVDVCGCVFIVCLCCFCVVLMCVGVMVC